MEISFRQIFLMNFVFLRTELCWKRVSPAENLEHSLSKLFLVLLPVSLEDNVAKVREVDEAIPGEVVAEVHDLLLHGVEAQTLEGVQQIPGVNGRLPDTSLKLSGDKTLKDNLIHRHALLIPEYCRHSLELDFCEFIFLLNDLVSLC